MDWVGQYLFSPDMFGNDQVAGALLAGTVVAAVSAVLGYFVVLRGLSFIGHAVTDIGFTGGAGSALLGLNALWGLITFCVAAALGVGALGTRARERDVATGVILALALGIGAMFLYIDTRYVSAPFTLLFGSIFEVDTDTTRAMVLIGIGCLAVLAVLYRPLLYSSLAPEAAEARGVPVRAISAVFLVCMAVAVAEAAQVVGVLLSTALLIGPPATASYLVVRPGLGIALAATIGVSETWLGIDLSYVSYNWPPGSKGWPVSFFITSLVLLCYILARLLRPAFPAPGRGGTGAPRGGVGMDRLIQPAMFGQPFMQNALLTGSIAAVLAGLVGFFVVLRGVSFAAHALGQIGFAGASGAVLVGVAPLWGLVVFALGGALGLGLLGAREHGRDAATALVLVAALGLGALFIALNGSYATAAFTLLFGSIVGISRDQVWQTGALALACVSGLAILYRPLLLSSVDAEMAAARGVPVRLVGTLFLVVVGVAAAVTIPTVGTLLIFSLMVGPAAAASAITSRPWAAMGLAIALSLLATWVGLIVAYDTGWPIGFMISAAVAVLYLARVWWVPV